jgi:hypothetical protein
MFDRVEDTGVPSGGVGDKVPDVGGAVTPKEGTEVATMSVGVVDGALDGGVDGAPVDVMVVGERDVSAIVGSAVVSLTEGIIEGVEVVGSGICMVGIAVVGLAVVGLLVVGRFVTGALVVGADEGVKVGSSVSVTASSKVGDEVTGARVGESVAVNPGDVPPPVLDPPSTDVGSIDSKATGVGVSTSTSIGADVGEVVSSS